MTLMRPSLTDEQKKTLEGVQYLVGSTETIDEMLNASPLAPFAEIVMNFLGEISSCLMKSPAAKAYADVVTLGFWLRKGSLCKMRDEYACQGIRVGRGIAFHIAPSNVPVNYAYSLVTGLLTGNANIVRIPSKDFPQVGIINSAFVDALEKYPSLKTFVVLVRYSRDSSVNDLFSSLCDTRIVWGGDATIAELRKSPLPPRSGEITFADRYSLAVVDSDAYMASEDKKRIAQSFYNDTYLTDQNACTSPRFVAWTGSAVSKAKGIFWHELHELAKSKYDFQSIQGINKLTSSYLAAVAVPGAKVVPHEDNLIVRVHVPKCEVRLMDYKDNSGYFFEYDCSDMLELRDFCNDVKCQTVGYYGDSKMFEPLLASGIRGVDRIVPIGKTMDFEFIWDGYNLVERLTRLIRVL